MAGWIKKVKAFQFKGILVILGCFQFIGTILFAERSGLSYREQAKKLTYLDADKVVTEEINNSFSIAMMLLTTNALVINNVNNYSKIDIDKIM